MQLLSKLELRGTFINLKRYSNSDQQHKSKSSALNKHLKKTLLSETSIKPDALYVSVDKHGLVKSYTKLTKSLTSGKINVHVFKRNGLWYFTDYQIKASFTKPKRSLLPSQTAVKGGIYKLIDAPNFLRSDKYAADIYNNKLIYDKLIVSNINEEGDCLDQKGDVLIMKKDLKFFSILNY